MCILLLKGNNLKKTNKQWSLEQETAIGQTVTDSKKCSTVLGIPKKNEIED